MQSHIRNVIFIAGTDTGVGKTVVTGLLARYLVEKGYRVVTQKWVETGPRPHSSDVAIHLKFMGKTMKDLEPFSSYMLPHAFKFASSPHLASRIEGKRVDIIKIKRSLKTLSENFDFVIVEGIGGVLVPLDSQTLLVDIVKELRLPVLVVAGNKLGAINHTLLTLEALKARSIKILGTIFNDVAKREDKRILKDNPDIVEKMSEVRLLGNLSWAKDPYRLREEFLPIGDRILARL